MANRPFSYMLAQAHSRRKQPRKTKLEKKEQRAKTKRNIKKLAHIKLPNREGKTQQIGIKEQEEKLGKENLKATNGKTLLQQTRQEENDIETHIENEVEPTNINYMATPIQIAWLNIQNINRSGIRQQLVKQAEKSMGSIF